MSARVKICGINTEAARAAAVEAKADYLGFVFFEKSPRNVSIETARILASAVPSGITKVALVVDASDAFLDTLTQNVPLDMLQLHGSETPERVSEIKARFSLPVMKAVGMREVDDLNAVAAYEAVADQLLIDAKPPKDTELPGGNGVAFDWRLVADYAWQTPWMLAGGLTPETVAKAIQMTGATQVDVSSGVERSPGEKDPAKIRALIEAAHSA